MGSMGFDLIIIDEYNHNPLSMSSQPKTSEKEALRVLNMYRNKLKDDMMTLVLEGILIGIDEISEALEASDLHTVLEDIKSLDDEMSGIELINLQYLKQVLRLFHSTSVSFQLNIEDSSDEDEDNEDEMDQKEFD